ncbi:hypothetical protein [uncultured Thiothrix sp.]|uniref:hypothetical protein n=1 Tax=uncultured Thiothrix sp. TaxID=223185 RepID=UPI002636B6C2|nr:hypothetical protein [uncultured Thiothrix sp.]HMT92586.1 hypothetical protein [Thiolinea sp.]
MSTNSAKPCILILGMHRSGTSCLAGSLQQQGVYLGQVHEWNPHNLKGNRENPKIMELNESLFAANHGSWDQPPVSPVQWTSSQAQQRDGIIHELNSNTAQAWGFKDPRTLINMDFWLAGLREHYPIYYVGTFRHPIAVAQSLNKRNGTPIETGVALWYSYNQRLLAHWEQSPFPLLCFDVDPNTYRNNFQQACEVLDLQPNLVEQPFFESQLRSTTEMLKSANFTIKEQQYLDCYARLQNIYFDWVL